MIRSLFLPAAMLVAAASVSPAFAAPELVSSTPVANASVTKPNRVEVRLSESVPARGAAIELTMTAMPGMAHHKPMKISGFTTVVSSDGRLLSATLPRPLPVGTYSVVWKAGGRQGQFSFAVK